MQQYTIIKELNGRETAAFDLILVLETYPTQRSQYSYPLFT
jgi:hypothetical protein